MEGYGTRRVDKRQQLRPAKKADSAGWGLKLRMKLRIVDWPR